MTKDNNLPITVVCEVFCDAKPEEDIQVCIYESRNTGTFVQNVNTTSVRKVLVLVLEINILALEF